MIALHSSVLCCFQFIGRVLVCVARLWRGEQLKDEGPGIGAGCWSRGRSDAVGVGGVAGPGLGLAGGRGWASAAGKAGPGAMLFFVIFCHFFCRFFVISLNLCHFFVIGAVILFSGPESLSFLCHFCVISRTSVMLSIIFGQSPDRTLAVSICENPRPNYSTTMLASERLKEP